MREVGKVAEESAASDSSTRLAYILGVPLADTPFENGRRWERSSAAVT
jgi:hypothetical protein